MTDAAVTGSIAGLVSIAEAAIFDSCSQVTQLKIMICMGKWFQGLAFRLAGLYFQLNTAGR